MKHPGLSRPAYPPTLNERSLRGSCVANVRAVSLLGILLVTQAPSQQLPRRTSPRSKDNRVKQAKRVSAICVTVAASVLFGGTVAHADSDGGLLGLGLLNTPSVTLACFPAGQVGHGNSFNGNQNINCSQSASATGTTPPTSSNGLTGFDVEYGSATAQPGEVAFANATCPAGKTPTGGGFSGSFGDSWQVNSSQLALGVVPNPNGWSVSAKNTGSGPQTLTAQVVCYNGVTS